MIKLLIGGDVCPINRNEPYFIDGSARAIFNDLLDEFHETDLSIVNLECPLVDKNSPIKKIGPVLGAPSNCVNGLKQAKIDVVNLANNHIMDHGPDGLFSTLKSCEDAGIATVGAGKNLESARRILIRDVGGIKIGIIGVAEKEFSIATNNSCGANSLDLIDFVRNINNNKGDFDYLIVLVHGGNEHYPLPSPRLKKVCHFLVEMGANAVIVQHTHCPGAYQRYKNAHIVYGQGNLVFDKLNKAKTFYEGYLVKISVRDDLHSTMSLVPYVQSDSQAGVWRMNDNEEQKFFQKLKKMSSEITDDVYVRDQWLKFCKSKKGSYLKRVFGHNYFFRKLASKRIFLKVFCSKESLLRFHNTISCEAHRDVLETLFDNRMI